MPQTAPSTPRTQPPQDTALAQALQRPYQHGFVTDIETDSLPPGLDEDTIRAISRKKREPAFLLQWRLAAPGLEACLRLHQLAASGNWHEPLSPVQGPGEALLLRSMECLEGGLEHEHALRETRLSTSHAFGWQVTGTRQAVLLVRRGIKRTYRRTRNLVANTLKAALPERLVAWIRQVRS